MSTLKANTIQNTNGYTRYTVHAWWNLNGTGTISITDDGNCSSATDNGVGTYTATFGNYFANATYAITCVAAGGDESQYGYTDAGTPSPYNTSQMQIRLQDSNSWGVRDTSMIWCHWVGDV